MLHGSTMLGVQVLGCACPAALLRLSPAELIPQYGVGLCDMATCSTSVTGTQLPLSVLNFTTCTCS